jgi:hypothetical protein
MNDEITIKIKPAHNIKELQTLEGGEYVRKIGLVYFQLMPDGKYIVRAVTAHTNGEWLISQLNKKLIYLPVDEIRAEVI